MISNLGWQCPSCGRCYAPHVAVCASCITPTMPPITALTTLPHWVYWKGADEKDTQV